MKNSIFSRYYPREHYHVICGKGEDMSCLTGEGVCVRNTVAERLLYDSDNVGQTRLAGWKEVTYIFTKSCSCQIIRNSVFDPFV